MVLKRLTLLLLILFSLVSCRNSDDSVAVSDRLNDSSIPATYAELESYALILDELQTEYNSMMVIQEHTFRNTVEFFNDLYEKGIRVRSIFKFTAISSPDEEVRDLASQLNLQITSWFFQIATGSDLHTVISGFTDRKEEYEGDELEVLEQVEELLIGYGLRLGETDKANLVNILVQMETISQQIDYLDIMGDPDGLIPGLFADLINFQTAYAGYLGYDNYAEYRMAFQMPESASDVENFLLEALDRLDVPYSDLIDQLQVLKAEQTGNPDPVIYFEDRLNYLEYFIESEYGFPDFNDRYFYNGIYRLEDILSTLFYIFDEYFGVQFVESVPPGELWHEDVKYYELIDKETEAPLSSLYMDVYDRTGKDRTSMIYQISLGYTDDDGIYVRPLLAFMMSIDKGTDETPSMVSLADTLSMFHEFGHLMQISLSSTGVSSEFIEVFSQLFEEFFYEKEIADRLLGYDNAWTEEDFGNLKKAIAAYEIDQKLFSFAMYLFNLRLYTDYGAEDSIDILTLQDDIISSYVLPVYYDSERG